MTRRGDVIDMTGQVFGQLTVLRLAEIQRKSSTDWVCLCSCGKEKVVSRSSLTARVGNRTISCGHVRDTVGSGYKHGESHTPLHTRWLAMRCRINNSRSPKFHMWGGRGIKIDYQPWIDAYEPFRDWARANGYEKGLSLERRDNEKGYSPENCYWATPQQQANNTRRNVRLTAWGETKTVREWARDARCWCNEAALYVRARAKKMSHEEMITRPSRIFQFPKYSVA